MKKSLLTVLLCILAAVLCLGGAAAEGADAPALSWSMPEQVILGDYLSVTAEPVEGAVSYEAVFTLTNPEMVICTKQADAPEDLLLTTDGLYEGSYQVTLSAALEDGSVLQGAAKPLHIRSVKKNYGFAMFADKTEVVPGEPVTISYVKYQENDNVNYPSQIVILSSDGQTQTVSDAAGTVEWVFNVPGDYEIGIGKCDTSNPAYKANLPLYVHVTDPFPVEGELDPPELSVRSQATMANGAIFDYVPCANAEAAGVSVTYTLDIYPYSNGTSILTLSQTGGTSFTVPGSALSDIGIYCAVLTAETEDGSWIPSSCECVFEVMDQLPELLINGRSGSAMLMTDYGEPFVFELTSDVTDGEAFLHVECMSGPGDPFSEEIPVDLSLLTEGRLSVPYSFPNPGLYGTYFYIEHSDSEISEFSPYLFLEVGALPLSELKYSWSFTNYGILVDLEEMDPRVDWCRAVVTRMSDGREISAGTPLQNQIFLPLDSHETYACSLQISYGAGDWLTDSVYEVIPLFDETWEKQYDDTFQFGQSGYGTIYVSKTEVTVGEEIEIFIWMNGNWMDVSIGDEWVSSYNHPECFEESTRYTLFHAKNWSFSEPGLYRIFGASNPARGSNATITDIVEVTVTGAASLETPVMEPVLLYRAGEAARIPLVYYDPYAEFFDLAVYTDADPDAPAYEHSFEAGAPITIPAEYTQDGQILYAEIISRSGSVVSEPAHVVLVPAEYPDPVEPDVSLKANGATEAAVSPGDSIEFTFTPFTLQTDLYKDCVLELMSGNGSQEFETVDTESGSFSCSLETQDLYRCCLILRGTDDNPDEDVLLGTVYVLVRDDPFVLGVPQAQYPRSVHWGEDLTVEVLPLAGADWYEVDVLEERYNYDTEESDYSSFFHIRLEEPGTVAIPTYNIISEYYHQNYNNDYWLRIRAGNEEHQAVSENEKQKNLFTVLMTHDGEIPINVSTTEVVAGEPFSVAVGMFSNSYESLEEASLSVGIYVDGMLAESIENVEEELVRCDTVQINTVGEHWIGAILTAHFQRDSDYEYTREYYSRKVPITVTGDRVLDAPSITVPESVNSASLPLEIGEVANAESYLARIWSDREPMAPLIFPLASSGTHSLDLSGLEMGASYRISVCAVAEGYASRETVEEFVFGSSSGTILHPLLTYGGSTEEAQISVGIPAIFCLEAVDALDYGFYPTFLLDGAVITSPGYDYTDTGFSIAVSSTEPGWHELSAELSGWYSETIHGTYTSNTLRFQVVSDGPVPVPPLTVPETIYEKTYFHIGVGESDIPGLEISAMLYNSNEIAFSYGQLNAFSRTIPIYADDYYQEAGAVYRLEITSSAPGYEDTVIVFPIRMVPVETPGITLSLQKSRVIPGESMYYAVHGVDCTLTTLHVQNLTNPSQTYSNQNITLSGTYVNNSLYTYFEADYDVWAEGTLESSETVESEHFTVTVAWLGTLDYPEVRLSPDPVYSSQYVEFSFSPVEHASSYTWYARSDHGSTTSGTAYPNQTNRIPAGSLGSTGKWYLEVVPRADGWKSPDYYTYRNIFYLFDRPDANITLMIGDEAATEYTFPINYSYDWMIPPITAHAPGASAIRFYVDGYLHNGSLGDTVTTLYYPDHVGEHHIYALATYDESISQVPYDLRDWEALSAPIILHITSVGQLNPPVLTVPEEVAQGELLTVDIAPVDHAEWYEIYIDPVGSGHGSCYAGHFDHAGRIEIPTGALNVGETYRISAASLAEGWETIFPDPNEEPEYTFRVTDPGDQAVYLSADRTEVQTMWEYCICLSAPSDTEARIYLNGAPYATTTGPYRMDWMFHTVPGVYTWQFSVRDGETGEWSEPGGDLQITVTAPKGIMAGTLEADVPASFPVGENLEITVTDPIPGVYEYIAEIYAPDYSATVPVRYDWISPVSSALQCAYMLTPGTPCRVDIVPYAVGYAGPRKSYTTVPVADPAGEITLTLNGAAENCSVLLGESVAVRVEAPEEATALAVCRNGLSTLVPGPVYEDEWSCAEEGTETIYAWYTTAEIPEGTTDYWNTVRFDGISETLTLTVTALGTLEPVEVSLPENLLAGEPLTVGVAEAADASLYTVDILPAEGDEALVTVSAEGAGDFSLPTEELTPGQAYRVRVTLSTPGWHPAVWEAGQFTLHYRLDPPQFTSPETLISGDPLRIQISSVSHAIRYTLRISDRDGNELYTETKSRAGTTTLESADYQEFLPTGRYTLTVECSADMEGFSTSSSTRELLVLGGNWTVLRLPAGLQAIEAEAFEGISANIVIIPKGVTAIGDRAFAGNAALRLVVLPDSVTGISPTAFADSPDVAILCDPGSPAVEYAEQQGIPLF